MTVAQAAEMLGYHRSAVYNLVKRGELRAELVSPRLLLLWREEVESFAQHPRRRGRPGGERSRRGSEGAGNVPGAAGPAGTDGGW